MNCKEINDQLSAYIDGELETEEKQLVDSHLNECVECRVKFAALERTVKMVRDLGELEVPAEVSLSLRKITNTNKEKVARVKRGPALPSLRYLVAIGAVAAIALVAVIMQIDMHALEKNPDQAMPLGKAPANLEMERAKNAPDAANDVNGAKSKGLPSSGVPSPGNPTSNDQIAGQTSAKKSGPWPVVVSTQKNYDGKAADELLADIKKKTDGLYTINDAKRSRADIMNTVVDGINKIDINGELMRDPINSLLDQTKRSALPVYIEKAKFNKKDCWVVIVRWGFGGVNNDLYRTSIYVTDLWFHNTFYYESN